MQWEFKMIGWRLYAYEMPHAVRHHPGSRRYTPSNDDKF